MSTICWFRRDLRLYDHHAFSWALQNSESVIPIFIFDSNILEKLPSKEDQRVQFIHDSLLEMENELQKYGSSIYIAYGDPIELIPKIVKKFKATKLVYNYDFENYAKSRDKKVSSLLSENNIEVKSFKDHVFYAGDEVLKDDGSPYKVFTPYKNKWLEKFNMQERVVPEHKCNLKKVHQYKNSESILKTDWMKMIGFTSCEPHFKAGTSEAKKKLKDFLKIIDDYDQARDIPSLEGTSNLSVYLRHGNISVRHCVKEAVKLNSSGASIWLSEIIWRDFYQLLLDKFPYIEKKSFSPQYDNINWVGGKKEFDAWVEGRTGFPLVDAAMRCFAATGMMHNRLRMVVASFLCKTLLVDWRKGEKYFADKLIDFDLAANNGGWQWSSSSGCDAQPYFRIFNPYNQSKKFDKDGLFIKEWVPELSKVEGKFIHEPTLMSPLEQAEFECVLGEDYPFPIVDYKKKRDEALLMYKKGLGKN